MTVRNLAVPSYLGVRMFAVVNLLLFAFWGLAPTARRPPHVLIER